jgi:hypothetical protein
MVRERERERARREKREERRDREERRQGDKKREQVRQRREGGRGREEKGTLLSQLPTWVYASFALIEKSSDLFWSPSLV